MSADVNPAHRVARPGQPANAIGLPVQYYHGPYAGKVIQTTIEEVQKPNLGRKYGLRDSRPLDPPAVVQIRMFELKNYGTPQEQAVEMDVATVHTPGLICYAELYPYNANFEQNPGFYADMCPPPSPIQPSNGPVDSRFVLACGNQYPPEDLPKQPRVPLPREAALPMQLHGERHQNVIVVPDIRGSAKKVMYFVFSELHVRLTGHFMLKYTAMSVDRSLERTKRAPLLAECCGGVFAIYPSKLHPPLRPSTELTNHLSRCGAKLHSRNKERSARGPELPTIATNSKKGPRGAQAEDDNADGSEDDATPGPSSARPQTQSLQLTLTPAPARAAADDYDRDREAWLARPLHRDAESGSGDALPPLNVAIPTVTRYRPDFERVEISPWPRARDSNSNTMTPTAPTHTEGGRPLRLHGEMAARSAEGRGDEGNGDEGDEDVEMHVERSPRAVLGWSSSNVRGGS